MMRLYFRLAGITALLPAFIFGLLAGCAQVQKKTISVIPKPDVVIDIKKDVAEKKLPASKEVQMMGVNLLQSNNVALDTPQNASNMRALRQLGANTVALIPFIRQSSVRACDLQVDADYSDTRIKKAIEIIHAAGMKVVLKPQFFVSGSWAGEIESGSEAGWACWFKAYRQIMINYADISNQTGVEMLVVGTELKKTELRPEWKSLITELRSHYPGQLSYVGHSVSSVMRFSGVEKLDSVAISFYHRLDSAQSRQEMRASMKNVADSMKWFVKQFNIPFWIAEVGITSRVGAMENPWVWADSLPISTIPDTSLQADVLDGWLAAFSGDWHQGILVWNWYSDPKAGGIKDVDFTIQNKPALKRVSCHWQGLCNEIAVN